MKPETLDNLVDQLVRASLRTFVHLCPQVRQAPGEKIELALAAMRAASEGVLDELMSHLKEAPWIAQPAYQLAVLTLAEAGAKVFRQQESSP
jgi:hypothetical protein